MSSNGEMGVGCGCIFFPNAKHKSQGHKRVELAGDLGEVATAEPAYLMANSAQDREPKRVGGAAEALVIHVGLVARSLVIAMCSCKSFL